MTKAGAGLRLHAPLSAAIGAGRTNRGAGRRNRTCIVRALCVGVPRRKDRLAGQPDNELVSYRFSTVRMADQIVVLNGAGVVEVGTHEALMAKGGQYAELYRIQAAAYR